METRLIDTLKECDVTGCCRLQGVSWDQGWGIVERAGRRGRARKPHRIPAYIGIDEKSFAKRHNYETLVCDLERGTIEYVVDDRKQESLESYFRGFEPEELEGVKAAAMDMWDPYIAATKAYVPDAEKKIVFDRFHVTRLVTEAVDKVRRSENKQLRQSGDDRLVGTKYTWLKGRDKCDQKGWRAFCRLRRGNLKTSRAWAMREQAMTLWDYRYRGAAENHFRWWYRWATHSRLEPMIAKAKMLKTHLKNILTYLAHPITNALSESLNSKIQCVKYTARGFRNRENFKTAIYFHCGGLDLLPAT